MKTIKKQIKALNKEELFIYKPLSTTLPHFAILNIIKALPIKARSYANALTTEVDWRPMTDKGSLVKRLKSFVYKRMGIKLDTTTLEAIGTIISDNTHATKEYMVDFTNSFDWESGDFGDHKSCFWQEGREHVRPAMEQSGDFTALRVFKPGNNFTDAKVGKFYKNYQGVGRSWVWKTKLTVAPTRHTAIESEIYVLINAYGIDIGTQAAILASYLGLPMKQIQVTNKSHTASHLYINNGMGFVIGEASVIKNMKNVDFNLVIPKYQPEPTEPIRGGILDVTPNATVWRGHIPRR